MKDDSIVAEVRAARRQIAEACGNDIRKICEHADKAYEAFKKRVGQGAARWRVLEWPTARPLARRALPRAWRVQLLILRPLAKRERRKNEMF